MIDPIEKALHTFWTVINMVAGLGGPLILISLLVQSFRDSHEGEPIATFAKAIGENSLLVAFLMAGIALIVGIYASAITGFFLLFIPESHRMTVMAMSIAVRYGFILEFLAQLYLACELRAEIDCDTDKPTTAQLFGVAGGYIGELIQFPFSVCFLAIMYCLAIVPMAHNWLEETFEAMRKPQSLRSLFSLFVIAHVKMAWLYSALLVIGGVRHEFAGWAAATGWCVLWFSLLFILDVSQGWKVANPNKSFRLERVQ